MLRGRDGGYVAVSTQPLLRFDHSCWR
jgi:hypothetical protein